MAEFALATPFPGLVERVGARDDLPPHVTVLVPCPGENRPIAEAYPAEPFVAMTEAMVDRFPDYPPCGGVHDRIVPHLTVAETQVEEAAVLVEPWLPLHSCAETVALYEHAHANRWHEVHTFGF